LTTRPSTTIDEISTDIFRLSTYIPEYDLEFNQFLVRDEQPLLYHTGMRLLFPLVQEAVSKLIRPQDLKWIGFSHFEQDECGSLNDWLSLAPEARIACNMVGAYINLNDCTGRQNQFLQNGETFSTGKYRFRFLSTPHVPHCWDATLLFEETQATLFCSDLLSHNGKHSATSPEVINLAQEALLEEQKGPFHDSMPYHTKTDKILTELAALKPRTLAIMHGASYAGDGAKALEQYRKSLREIHTA
jgi:flavorubredoxin